MPSDDAVIGYVYLLKHGARHEYKIGRANNRLRGEGEIRIELPEKVEPIHVIETDDPGGVEAYWHRRFTSKRKEGEWFSLTTQDVHSKGGSKSAERVAVKPAAAAGELDGEGNGAHFFCACKVPGVSCNPAWPQCTPSLCASRFSMRVRSSVSRRAVGGGLC